MSVAASGSAVDGPTISVHGRGEAAVAPDSATIVVGVQLVRPTVGDATAEVAQRTRAVIDALRDHGVAPADTRTANYNVHPEHDHRPRPGPSGIPPVIGYRVSNTLDVLVRDVDRLSEVIDAATRAAGSGATVHGLHFGIADPGAAVREARERAFADALEKAEHLATLAGVTLGAVVEMSESSGGGRPMRAMRRSAEMAAMAAPPPMEPGTGSIGVGLDVTWAIAPAS